MKLKQRLTGLFAPGRLLINILQQWTSNNTLNAFGNIKLQKQQ